VAPQEPIDRAIAFWTQNFFESDATPRYYADRLYPIDSQCLAQAIETFAPVVGERARGTSTGRTSSSGGGGELPAKGRLLLVSQGSFLHEPARVDPLGAGDDVRGARIAISSAGEMLPIRSGVDTGASWHDSSSRRSVTSGTASAT
jgi:hypothetical protein